MGHLEGFKSIIHRFSFHPNPFLTDVSWNRILGRKKMVFHFFGCLPSSNLEIKVKLEFTFHSVSCLFGVTDKTLDQRLKQTTVNQFPFSKPGLKTDKTCSEIF